jgi:hypothetical protein
MVRRTSLIILAIALLVIASYVFLAPGYPSSTSDLHAHDRFVRRDLPSTAYLNDLGVGDVNDDLWLDVYTTNHDVRDEGVGGLIAFSNSTCRPTASWSACLLGLHQHGVGENLKINRAHSIKKEEKA